MNPERRLNICIVGTGSAGWMAANWFANSNHVGEISVIGSPEVPPIGVGESNTMNLIYYHNKIGVSLKEFITQSDAAVKYGVYYKNWSKNEFIHNFKGLEPWKSLGISALGYFQSFGNKPLEVPFHDYYGRDLMEAINKNLLMLDEESHYPKSYHFDAGKYIKFLEDSFPKMAARYGKKTQIINKPVTKCIFTENNEEKVESLILSDGTVITADYFVFATGSSKFTEDVLKIQYNSLSDVLLTNKALVYPLKYKNRREQFHPYTVAKTMKHGWRWITPTWSRIGTGYVFSDRHVSVDDARKEFLDDIGDHSITPHLVDFTPRYSKKTYYDNFCLVGMANGFLEPLDAPGITITLMTVQGLSNIFHQQKSLFLGSDVDAQRYYLEIANNMIQDRYEFWASFILTQYKTCYRNDTPFWRDHKKVHFDYYEKLMNTLENETIHDAMAETNRDMLYCTMAAKDYGWNLPFSRKPFKIPQTQFATQHHEDYIQSFYSK